MGSPRFGLIAGVLLLLAASMPAESEVISATFTGTVTSGGDSNSLTGLPGVSGGDSISGNLSFDTGDVVDGVGTDTLVISITDNTQSNAATYFDTDGSYFTPATGQYSMELVSTDPDYFLLQDVLLNFLSPSIQSGVLAQNFSIGAGSGSTGEIDGYVIEDDVVLEQGSIYFSIDSASVIGAPMPEPASATIFGLGLLALVRARRPPR
jgi:hypothetical protein